MAMWLCEGYDDTKKNDMFCNQCEQRAQGRGCTKQGVCGKTADVAGIQDLMVYAARGLALTALEAEKKDCPSVKQVGHVLPRFFNDHQHEF